jgi:hypothetical protein
LAELALPGNDRQRTCRNARAGLDLLRDYRARFGSVDLRTSSTALADELATIGLTATLETRSPVRVFSWLERCRAQAFRLRPVRPPTDGPTADAVAELRHYGKLLRTAELAGQREPHIRRKCVALERALRARGWRADGAGELDPAADFRAVAAKLAAHNAVLVDYFVHAGRLSAVVLTDHRTALVELGDWPVVAESLSKLRSDLDALYGRRLRASMKLVIEESVRRQVATLTRTLLEPLRDTLEDRELVVVPTRSLCSVPWGLLPDLRGRPVTVAPSATTWLRGATSADRRADRPPLLVAGPDLTHAKDEVAQLADVYPDAVALSGSAATVDATLSAMAGRRITHFATHGHHEQDNVLFSRLDLADGPLMAHDVYQLDAAPEHVVLSSCDVGRAMVRTGDEMLGFTAALLYGNTKTVVSSVARVLDDAASPVMLAYHRALVSGHRPARALADAITGEGPLPFVCFGTG